MRTLDPVSTDGDRDERLSTPLRRAFPDPGDAASDLPGDAASEFDVPDAEPPEPFELPAIVSPTERAEARSARTQPHERRSAVAAAGTSPQNGDPDGAVRRVAGSAALRSPVRRPRVRRVTRVLRHIDPWSTFKVGLLFSLVGYLIALTSGVLLWRVAAGTGTLDNVERWFTQFGWETFELQGGEIFHNAWIIGLFVVVATTGGLVLLATVFNLVSDIIGGIRLTVLEEEVVERTISSTRQYVVRQGEATPSVPSTATSGWTVDD